MEQERAIFGFISLARNNQYFPIEQVFFASGDFKGRAYLDVSDAELPMEERGLVELGIRVPGSSQITSIGPLGRCSVVQDRGLHADCLRLGKAVEVS